MLPECPKFEFFLQVILTRGIIVSYRAVWDAGFIFSRFIVQENRYKPIVLLSMCVPVILVWHSLYLLHGRRIRGCPKTVRQSRQ